MSKSMADLMASPDAGLPERTFRICVAGKLVSEYDAADRKLMDLETEIEQLEAKAQESETPTRRRMAVKPRVAELREQAQAQAVVCDEIRERMKAHEIELLVRAKEPGEWQQFTDAHPARDKDDDKPGYMRDIRHADLTCNIDELAQSAGDFIVKYGDDDPTPEMWAFLSRTAARADLVALASTIVALHERGVDAGKSRVGWLETRPAVAD